jgi:hypothetical protein
MFFLDAGNDRIGVGTAAPDTLLHLSGADTAVIRLENTDTSLGANQLIGALEFEKQDGSGAGAGVFGGIRMRVEDSVGANAYMTFSTGWSSGMDTERVRIQSSGGFITNPIAGGHAVFNDGGIDADFRVESDTNSLAFYVEGNTSNVYFGTSSISGYSQTSGLGVLAYNSDDGSAGGSLILSTNSDRGWSTMYMNRFAWDSGDDQRMVQFSVNANVVGTIKSTSSATTFNTSSDQRLKENIADADDAGNKIDAIQVRQFDWKVDGSHQDYGMVAQELLEVAPEAVASCATQEEMMGVDYSKLVPMLIKEIQSLRQRVAQLEE